MSRVEALEAEIGSLQRELRDLLDEYVEVQQRLHTLEAVTEVEAPSAGERAVADLPGRLEAVVERTRDSARAASPARTGEGDGRAETGESDGTAETRETADADGTGADGGPEAADTTAADSNENDASGPASHADVAAAVERVESAGADEASDERDECGGSDDERDDIIVA